MAKANNDVTLSIVFIVVLLVFIVAAFLFICANSFLMSRTITGPWQRMNYLLEQSISKFVPKDFLHLIHCNSVTDVKLGKAEKCDLTVLSLDIKYSITHDDHKPDHQILFLNEIFSFIGPLLECTVVTLKSTFQEVSVLFFYNLQFFFILFELFFYNFSV